MKLDRRFVLIVLVAAFLGSSAAAQLVAPTEAQTPEKEKAGFHLPPGFEIQLVASEPDINKPMNMAFDTRGRLWVTHSVEYPWAAADPDKARDKVSILSDFGPDGKARKVHTFADKLNIPIGVLPLKGGREVIVWSIPHIWKLTDTDGDDVADKREILFGPFGYDDTHGNQNAFRLGLDGWVYACHGFRNHSKVKMKGEGPVVLEMQSGNTYRFKPDGSAIEQFTHGQVNPFGLTFDPWGNLYSADCHSRPVTLLLRGAHYQSFGKPHDGLGFAPDITSNDHGSSGIGGIAYYQSDHFPPPFRDCLYIGNVVTGKVQRDAIEWRGSTPWIEKPADFVTCDDKWFRPVDIQLGPDGALYIADFYNCIIGHYEVDLKHPRRDRTRGRIWRIVHTGLAGQPRETVPAPADLTKQTNDQLIEALGTTNISHRYLATHELHGRLNQQGAAMLARQWQDKDQDPTRRAHLLWIAQRFDLLPADHAAWLEYLHGGDCCEETAVQMARIMGAMSHLFGHTAQLAAAAAEESDPMFVRAAVEALALHPRVSNIEALLIVLDSTDPKDAALIHSARIALRAQLRGATDLNQVKALKLKPGQLERIMEIALAVPTEAAAWFTFDYVRQNQVTGDLLSRCMTHVAAHVGEARLNEVAEHVRKQYAGDVGRQAALYQSLRAGMGQRGQKVAADSAMGKWGEALAGELLRGGGSAKPQAWAAGPVEGGTGERGKSPFGLRERACEDGTRTIFIDSIVGGESLTGVLRSGEFTIPRTLSFYLCGHNGLPGTNPPAVNHIRLRLAGSGEIVATQAPPRNDIAKKFTWDLSSWAGRKGVIEIVDASALGAYAWLGVARFEPAVVVVPAGLEGESAKPQSVGLGICEELKLTGLAGDVRRLLEDQKQDNELRAAAARTLMVIDRPAATAALIAMVQSPGEPAALKAAAAQALAPVNTTESRTAVTAALAAASAAQQQQIAVALASSSEGADALLAAVALGKASPRLLQDRPVLDRLSKANVVDREKRIAELTKNLPPAEARLDQLIKKLAAAFPAAKPSLDNGRAVFAANCAACHQIAGQGNRVGPQLDGIAARGVERLLEDVLDSNRNVDAAFRALIITKSDGDVVSGLKLREEGGVVVMVTTQGKEVRLDKADIAETRQSNLSPMPSNVADVVKEKDLLDLLAFLMEQRGK